MNSDKMHSVTLTRLGGQFDAQPKNNGNGRNLNNCLSCLEEISKTNQPFVTTPSVAASLP